MAFIHLDCSPLFTLSTSKFYKARQRVGCRTFRVSRVGMGGPMRIFPDGSIHALFHDHLGMKRRRVIRTNT